MIAIGMGLAFVSYTAGLWGYCLVRGYNVTPADLFKTTWPGVQVNITPSPGHKLGTIQGPGQSTTNPSQLLGPAGGV